MVSFPPPQGFSGYTEDFFSLLGEEHDQDYLPFLQQDLVDTVPAESLDPSPFIPPHSITETNPSPAIGNPPQNIVDQKVAASVVIPAINKHHTPDIKDLAMGETFEEQKDIPPQGTMKKRRMSSEKEKSSSPTKKKSKIPTDEEVKSSIEEVKKKLEADPNNEELILQKRVLLNRLSARKFRRQGKETLQSQSSEIERMKKIIEDLTNENARLKQQIAEMESEKNTYSGIHLV